MPAIIVRIMIAILSWLVHMSYLSAKTLKMCEYPTGKSPWEMPQKNVLRQYRHHMNKFWNQMNKNHKYMNTTII